MSQEIYTNLINAIKSDNLAVFSKLIKTNKNLSLGRFPVLSICYMYSAKQIINHFEDKEEQTMAATLFSTEFREEMDDVAQRKAFEDIVRKVKQASIERKLEEAMKSGDTKYFQKMILEKNRYKNQFPIP